MLLSRFWYFLLAAAFGAALTAALLAQVIFNRQYEGDLANELVRDRVEVELWMRLDARSRLDAIAPVAAHGEVRDALRKASRRKKPHVDPGDRRSLEKTLRSLNKQLDEMQGDLLFALDGKGVIVAQLGSSEPPPAAGLGATPLVRKALAGFVRDDVWIYNGQIYRMAARPVIDRGRYVGALVHGKRLDDQFAQKLGERVPGASVGFFRGDRIAAAHVPPVENAARPPDMEPHLREVIESEALQKGDRSEPMEIAEHARAIYSLMTGSAAHAGVGYAVARPRHVITSPLQIFERASAEDVSNLPWLLVAGLPVLLFLLGMLWIFLERDRPLGRLRDVTAELAKKAVDRVDIGIFRGRYRRIAENVNEAMDKAAAHAAEASPERRAANLDAILGPTSGEKKGGDYFGFASDDEPGDQAVPTVPGGPGPAAPPQAPAQPPAAAAPPPPQPPAAAAPPPPPAPSRASAEPTVKRPTGAQPPPPAPPKAPPQAPPPAPPSPPQAPPPPERPKPSDEAPTTPAATPDNAPDWEDDEGATMVADVPNDLIAQSSSEEDEHFRQVFDEYVKMKQACGEPTGGLTFDKFVQTLRKNRDQIIERHGAAKVRFTVYEKNGKAALKATPVKT